MNRDKYYKMLIDLVEKFKEEINKLSLDDDLKEFSIEGINKIDFSSKVLSYLYTNKEDSYIKQLNQINKGHIDFIEYSPINLLKTKTKYVIISLEEKIDSARFIKYVKLIKSDKIIVVPFSNNLGKGDSYDISQDKPAKIEELLGSYGISNKVFNILDEQKSILSSYIKLIKSKADKLNQNIELMLIEENQKNQIRKTDSNRSSDKNDLTYRLDKQDQILKKIISDKIDQILGLNSDSYKSLESKLNKFVNFQEMTRGKKVVLQYPENFIKGVENDLNLSFSNTWNDLLSETNNYTKRYSKVLTEFLDKANITNNYKPSFPYGSSDYNEFMHKAINTPFSNFKQEIGKRRIGEYLMKARMLPMYLLMGASMMGVGLNQYRRFFGPAIIFIMGLGFFMVYKSKEQEEKFEREKAKDYIFGKAKDEIEKRMKEFCALVSKAIDDYQKSLKSGSKSYYESNISDAYSKQPRNSIYNKNDISNVLSRKKSDLKFFYSAIEKFQLKLKMK